MAKILLVEDDKSLREIYGVRLLAEGFDIVSAGDGEEALAMAIKEKPQLIISDVMMPKISGFDMLDILRSTTETRNIKVIMMTALSSDDQRTRGEQLGADKYLVKSQVGIEDVVRTVHEVLGDKSDATQTTVPPSTNTTPSSTTTPEPEEPGDTPSSDDKPQQSDDGDVATPQGSAEPDEDTSEGSNSSAEDESSGEQSSDNSPVNNNSDNPKEASTSVVTDDSDQISPAKTDTTDSTATPSPESDDPGPLPPQPTELESEPSLPQPTAPFSSQRPANLGESIMNPSDQQTPATDPNAGAAPQPQNDSASPVGEPTAPSMPPAEPTAPSMPPMPETPEAPAAPETAPTPEAPATEVPAPEAPSVPPMPETPEAPAPEAPQPDGGEEKPPVTPGAGTPPAV